MKNVKREDKHRVMAVERVPKLEVSSEAPLHECTILEGRNGPNEESYGGNEREYEEGKSDRRFGSQNRFPIYGFHQWSPSTIEVQVAFSGLV